MFLLLEEQSAVSKAQRALEKTLQENWHTKEVRNIGFPSTTYRNAKIHTDGELWFHSRDEKRSKNPRRLNWFGKYVANGTLQISVEINTAYQGVNGKVAGYFAMESENGRIYLFPTGRVGGGAPGVSKTNFLQMVGMPALEAAGTDGETRAGIVVLPVEGGVRSLVRYINKIADFKQKIRDGIGIQKVKPNTSGIFSPEPRGRRTGTRSSEIDYVSRHGDVVDALREWRGTIPLDKTEIISNDDLIDLMVKKNGKLTELYEVKISSARSDIYAAVGQLIIHGAQTKCERTLVVPTSEHLPLGVAEALKHLDIQVIEFLLDDEKATILA